MFELVNDPLGPLQNSSLHFLHLPSCLQLLLSGQVIPSICPHACIVLGDHTDAIAAFKATDKLNTLVAWGNILAVVSIHVETDESV